MSYSMFKKMCSHRHLFYTDIKEVMRFEAVTVMCIQIMVLRVVMGVLLISSAYSSSSTSPPTVDLILPL